jgi:GTPase
VNTSQSGADRTRSSPAGSPGRVPTLAIVGRPNVGKSSLFNRITGHRGALVEDAPGTTRDRLIGDFEWQGKTARLIDTGGLEAVSSGVYSGLIRSQIQSALDDADVILFTVDGRDGLTAEDYAVADLLRRVRQPVLLVVNKVDNEQRELNAVEFYELGLGAPIPVSAYHGYGVAELLDSALALAPEPLPTVESENRPAIAIVGRPNTGKSMLLNALLGEERVIVSDVAGTTRDAVDTALQFEGRALTLIDTAGIRRRGHIQPGVERHSVMRSSEAIERCDVAILLMDAADPAAAQDAHIVQLVQETRKGLILTVNKADLLEGPDARQEVRRLVRYRFRFVPWAPIVFISAKEREGLDDLLRTALEAADRRAARIPTGALNALLQRAFVQHPPRTVQGRRLKLLYATQPEASPPTFVLFVNDAKLLHFSYERYLENRIRQAYGFLGTAVRLVFKSRSESAPTPRPGR